MKHAQSPLCLILLNTHYKDVAKHFHILEFKFLAFKKIIMHQCSIL